MNGLTIAVPVTSHPKHRFRQTPKHWQQDRQPPNDLVEGQVLRVAVRTGLSLDGDS
jgi:hypothetical protein